MTAPQPAPAAVPDGMAAAFESDCAAREAGFEAIRRDLAKRAPAPAPAAADARGVVVDASPWLPGARVSVDAETLTALVILMDGERGMMPPAARVAVTALANTVRPLPTAAGAVDAATLAGWRMKAGAARNLASEAGDEDAMCLRGVADALDAACDALASATPAVPAPDRAAVEAAIYAYGAAAVAASDIPWATADTQAGLDAYVDEKRAALLALVFPVAPAPAPDAAGENGGGR